MRKSLAIASVLVTSMLFAPTAAEADSGFYIGAGVGGATLESDFGDSGIPGVPGGIDEDDTALKIFGGYEFDLETIQLGVELGYTDFGEPEIDTALGQVDIDVTGISAWGTAGIAAGPIDLFAKIGFIAWDVEASVSGFSESDNGTDLAYGVGVGFDLGPVELRGEYELFDVDDADLSMLSVSIIYRFD